VTLERAAVRRALPSLVMVASGFAGLGYQVVWTEQCAAWLGHETAAVLAVVAAFFGGLAVGGLALGPRIEASARPVRWYVACELTVAGWCALLARAMPAWAAWLDAAIGVDASPLRQWAVAFGGAFVAFLPATAAMGATLPALESLLGASAKRGRSIAALYAANTFGAVLGVLGSAFWLIPRFGLARTAALAVGLNLSCAALAVLAFPRTAGLTREPPSPARAEQRSHLVRLALTGFLGIGYEVTVVRVLSQVT
jgi:spermidine synthase